MKSICLFFQIHQPFRHRRYKFFDIGNDHYYYDDYANETMLRNVAEKSYLPTNQLLLKMIRELKGEFKIAISITGVALEQFELYAPEVLTSFQELARTGAVEFLSETYSHSLASLRDKSVFEQQVREHSRLIFELFGQKPKIFRNTEMIYSDQIGAQLFQMGYKGVLTEGVRHVLGWKSPNFLYINAHNPRMKVLLRNYKLSDDIAFRFSNPTWSEYPLTAEKFTGWLNKLDTKEELVNLFLTYESFGVRQPRETGIFDFLEQLIRLIAKSDSLKFATPSEVVAELQPISVVSVPNPISWADEERDLTAWLGNDMQKEAFNKLYELHQKMTGSTKEDLMKDWNYLQSGDHFYYMSTKFFCNGEVKYCSNPFDSPFEAFINYMNVLSDFKIRLLSFAPGDSHEQEVSTLNKLLAEKEKKLKKMKAELLHFQSIPKKRKTSKRK